MIPVTYPSSVSTSKESQMVVFALSSVAGLQRWTDYIPVKFQSSGTANSFNVGGYLACDFLTSSSGKQAWVDYIPVFVDVNATDAWQVSATGFIPFNSLAGGGLGSTLDFNFVATGTLDPSITFTRASSATFVGSNGLIQSATTNTPRFDYDPVTLAAKGLLIEEQRTNLLTYSEQFDNAAWSKNNGGNWNAVTVTANQAIAPDGTLTADTVTAPATGSNGVLQQFACAANTTYTFSVWARDINYGSFELIYSSQALPSTTFTTTPVSISTTTWTRVSITFTTGAAQTALAVGIGRNATSSSKSFYVWGAQLEAGSFATSYIPTVASQVTRSADVASVNTLSPWYNATEGAVFIEGTGGYAFEAHQGLVTDYTNFWLIGDISATGADKYFVGNVSSVAQWESRVFSGKAQKMAFAYAANNIAGAANGALQFTDTSAAIPTNVNTAYISAGRTGWVRRITYYPRRLSNAELQALTA